MPSNFNSHAGSSDPSHAGGADKSHTGGGFPAHKPLPEFMKGRGPAPAVGAARHPKRAWFHDYCSPGFYLITATTLPGSPRLSEISCPKTAELKKGEMIIPAHTPLGEAVKAEIQAIPSHHPEMKILRFVVMPDHIHFVLQVTARLKRMLGSELAGFSAPAPEPAPGCSGCRN